MSYYMFFCALLILFGLQFSKGDCKILEVHCAVNQLKLCENSDMNYEFASPTQIDTINANESMVSNIRLFPYNPQLEYKRDKQSSNTTTLLLKPGDKLYKYGDVQLTTIDKTKPLMIPLTSKYIESYFFFTIECNVAYSDTWFFLNEEYTDITDIVSKSSFVNIVILSTSNCSSSTLNVNYSQASIYDKVKRFEPFFQNHFYILNDFLTLPSSDESTNPTFSWLKSWSTEHRPTMEIMLISPTTNGFNQSSYNNTNKSETTIHTERILNDVGLYKVIDATGTTGWGANAILGLNAETGGNDCSAEADSTTNGNVTGICGTLVFINNLACDSKTLPRAYRSGLFALVPRGVCSFVKKAQNIEQAGYSAIIIFNTQHVGKITMSGDSGGVKIPAIMIDYAPALILLKLIPSTNSSSNFNNDNNNSSSRRSGSYFYDVFVRLYYRVSPVQVAILNRLGEVEELGQMWSNISEVVLAQSRYQDYYYKLQTQVDELSMTCQVISIADQQPYWSSTFFDIPEYFGAEHNVSYHTTAYSSMYLYLDTRCLNGWDNSCPQWDKLLSIYACVVNTTDRRRHCSTENAPVEVLRSVTSYSRPHAGLVDISSFLFSMANVRGESFSLKNMKLYIDGSTMYKFTIKLFLKPLVTSLNGLDHHTYSDYSTVAIPLFAYKLWSGNDGLTSTYNQRQMVYSLPVPSFVRKLSVVGYITGHGWGKDVANCAEFCLQSHNFRLSSPGNRSASHVIELSATFDKAGSDFGCEQQISGGVTANQYGTWYFGRGGWCPGLIIPPLVWNVSLPESSSEARASLTESVASVHSSRVGVTYRQNGTMLSLNGNRTITMSYFSLVNGTTYAPIRSPGDNNGFGALIFRNIWLVAYGSVPETSTCLSYIDVNKNTTELGVQWTSSPTVAGGPKEWVIIRIYLCSNDTNLDTLQGCMLVLERLEHDNDDMSSRTTSKHYNVSADGHEFKSAGNYYIQVFKVNNVGSGPPCCALALPRTKLLTSNHKSNPKSVGMYIVIAILGAFILAGMTYTVMFMSKGYHSMRRFLILSNSDHPDGEDNDVVEVVLGQNGRAVEMFSSLRPRSSLMEEVPAPRGSPIGSHVDNPIYGFSEVEQRDDDYEATLETLHPK